MQLDQAATARPLPFRRRRDVVVEPVALRGQRRWHVKDPLTLRYWQFGEEELFLWQQLDGTIGLDEWQQRFQRRFAPQRIELSRLHEFLAMLHREGLAFSNLPGQADTMLERRGKSARDQWLGGWTNVLAIRFRGLDPESFLSRTYPTIAWLFHPLAVVLGGILMLSAIVLLMVQWTQFTARLPEMGAFLTPQNIVWLATGLALAKVLHELGHAFTNKHFGGECHELGLMLLVFTPCLYCNVSDTWLVSNKWRRMAVSLAGIYVELVLAAAATWLWWFTAPGVFNSLCLSVMLVCSVSTVLFNGNPLLRYDGYFVLSDLLEFPNLRPEADARLRAFVARHWLGIEDESLGPSQKGGGWLLVYAAASLAYRALVVGLILWVLYEWLSQRRLEIVGRLLVGIVVLGVAGPAMWRAVKCFAVPGHRRVPKQRFFLLTALAVTLLSLLLAVPLPRRVEAPVTVRPGDSLAVYVSVPGLLLETVRPGTTVRQGEQLARLRNDDIDFQIARLTSERDMLRKHLETLRMQQVHDMRPGVISAGGQRPIVEQSLEDTERQLQQRQADREQLVLRAPVDGVVLAPRGQLEARAENELGQWTGSPLDEKNTGCFLEAGVLLCHIGARSRIEGMAMLAETDVSRVRAGQEVTVQLDELPGRFLAGRVAGISEIKADAAPLELVAKRRLPVTGTHERTELLGTYYEMRIALQDQARIPFGASGRARVQVAPETLMARIYESLCHTFGFARS